MSREELNEKDHHGNTPLMLATKLTYLHLNYYHYVKKILSKKVDPLIRDNYNTNPLEEALSKVPFPFQF
jgi:ankyrin repeat protein